MLPVSFRQRLTSFSLAAAALVAFAAPRAAQACTSLACFSSDLAPAAGATIPASAPAFPLMLRGITGAEAKAAFRLLGPSGDPVVAQVEMVGSERLVLTPGAPLLEGATYTLEHRERCDGKSPVPSPPTTQSTSFTTSAAVPLPTAFGTLGVKSVTLGTATVYTSAGSCVTDAHAEILSLLITPDATLTPWLPMVRFVTTVDGKPWAADSFGHQPSSFYDQFHPTQAVDRIYALCGSPPKGAAPGVTLGEHTIELTADMAGLAAPLPVLKLTHTFTCDPAATVPEGGAGNGGSAGSGGAGAGASGASAVAGSAGASTARGDAPADAAGSGCSSSGRPVGGSSPIGLALGCAAAALAVTSRKRRRSPGQPQRPNAVLVGAMVVVDGHGRAARGEHQAG
jgi:hypothetical protein